MYESNVHSMLGNFNEIPKFKLSKSSRRKIGTSIKSSEHKDHRNFQMGKDSNFQIKNVSNKIRNVSNKMEAVNSHTNGMLYRKHGIETFFSLGLASVHFKAVD